MMRILSGLRTILRGGTSRFSEFERVVLNAISDALPDDVREKFNVRVRSVNLIQRIDGGREVNCYVMRGGKPFLDAATRVNSIAGEHVLAKIAIGGPLGTANSAQVWLVDGNLFSIEFDASTEHADATAVTGIRVVLMGE